jgi:predicted ATPase
MSDGTLRSLGVLTALFHPYAKGGDAAPFLAIEEPEITIHPGAAGIIMDALVEAADSAQVVATTHSPDLLDHPDIQSDWLLAVTKERGDTQISKVDGAAMKAIRQSLYTPGELLRAGQLGPDPDAWPKSITDADLFELL